MLERDEQRWSGELPRCVSCEDVIGVYEPLVYLDRGLARHTSRAAEPSVTDGSRHCYHLDCYERVIGKP